MSRLLMLLRWVRTSGTSSLVLLRGLHAALGHLMAFVEAVASDPACTRALVELDGQPNAE